jgi:hypothetical protein
LLAFKVSFPRHLAHLFPYQPALIVDTGDEMLICEVKAKNELGDPIVKAKDKVACRCANGAEKIAKDKAHRKIMKQAGLPRLLFLRRLRQNFASATDFNS